MTPQAVRFGVRFSSGFRPVKRPVLSVRLYYVVKEALSGMQKHFPGHTALRPCRATRSATMPRP